MSSTTRAPGVVGASALLRLIGRRDRVLMPVWVGGITAITAASAGAVQDLYTTPEQIAGYARTVRGSASTELLNGEPVAVDTIGGIVAYESTFSAVVAVSLMALFTVVRHTRAEEESGRAEMLRSAPVGRHAATVAAVLVAGTASLVVGLLDALVLVGLGLPVSGSVLRGAGVAGIGLVFTGVAAAAAQVTASTRGALGIGGAALAGLLMLRGVGDVTDTGLAWLSPFGWAEQARAYGDERVWPLLLLPLVAAGALTLAARLLAQRDAGAGLRHPSPGPARAAVLLGTPVGLAWRLQRGLWIGWAIGLGLMAVLFGSLGDEVVQMVESNPELAEMILAQGGSGQVLDRFFAYGVGFLAVLACVPGVTSVLRLRSEETAGRAEALLATGLSRARWVAGVLVVATLASIALLLLVGAAVGGTDALVSGRSGSLPRMLAAATSLTPATLVVAGVTAVLVGWLPRFALAAWAFAGFAILQNYLGALLDLPGAVTGLSPYTHLPALPIEAWEPGPFLAEVALAAALFAAALLGVRRRDLG